jgi:hypothetical protein
VLRKNVLSNNGRRSSQLIAQLDEVAIDPSSSNDCTIEAGDSTICEDSGHHRSNKSTDSVSGEDTVIDWACNQYASELRNIMANVLESIIKFEDVFDLGGEIGPDRTNHTDEQRGRRSNISSSRSNRN